MKNTSRNIVIAIVVIVIIGLIVWYGGSSSAPSASTGPNPLAQVTGSSTAPLPVSETTKVGGSLLQYQNAELGFSVDYPNAWEKGEMPAGVQFIIPVDQNQVSTVNRLEADINVTAGKCAFPPVTTVKDRGTLTVGGDTLNMITMSNNVQGRSYYNRMYSLQKNPSLCYMFTFAYVALSPESKGLTGSNLTQAKNNDNAILTTADAAFTNMVKSFKFVAPAAGEDETKAAPKPANQ